MLCTGTAIKKKSVLISGAGIAGPALAFWLQREGFSTTIVELAPELRPGGQAVDIRGAALEVVEKMGLLGKISDARTRLKGMSMLDNEGVETWRSTERTLSAGRLDSDDIEILRDDLVRILAEATSAVSNRFGSGVQRLEEQADAVLVTFEDGAAESFDFVVGADGLYSRTRRLAFGPHSEFVHHLGMYVAIFTTDNFLHLEDWQTALWGESAGLLVYPARQNQELRCFLGFQAPATDDRLNVSEQMAMVREHCAGLGWEAPRLIDAMARAEAFYFGPMAQVRMPSWHS